MNDLKSTDLKPFLQKIAGGQTLTDTDAAAAFDIIMAGEATPAQVGGLIMGLRTRGESVQEIAGAVRSVRARMLRVAAPEGAMDIVGTGGDHTSTYNISTTAAFVVAGAGVPVAKHGNRAISSRSGAGDVLAALGVKLDVPPGVIARAIREAGVGFMFAPAHHASFRHVGAVRTELGTRTIFNLLGPLANPAGVDRILMGVFSESWVEPIARVLATLGARSAWVVHGFDGSDEITTAGPTKVAALAGGSVRVFEVSPEDARLRRSPAAELKGGDAAFNAHALRQVLEGAPGPYRDVAVLNAAAALIIAGRVADLKEGAELAKHAIDSGAARSALERLITITNAPPGQDVLSGQR
jgi:anthranilate phosphoribosyltransferase